VRLDRIGGLLVPIALCTEQVPLSVVMDAVKHNMES
jgi:hypothetical protein